LKVHDIKIDRWVLSDGYSWLGIARSALTMASSARSRWNANRGMLLDIYGEELDVFYPCWVTVQDNPSMTPGESKRINKS
jgi:hypothetical protein